MKKVDLQPYLREAGQLLSDKRLYTIPPALPETTLHEIIDRAFDRARRDKKGKLRTISDSPETLVELCITHLKERSDPVLSPFFLSQCDVKDIFELDAVAHEMQRNRMAMGVFYQYLILELIQTRFPKCFDGAGEDDITADIDTLVDNSPQHLRLYISVKKSGDTVGGQDVEGVITRLEKRAKQEKNLTRPYLGVMCVATPTKGKIPAFEKDRKIKYTKTGRPYSMNCETWGPGFIFPYFSGHNAHTVYAMALRRVADYFPFLSLAYRQECSELLQKRLVDMELLGENGRISAEKFLAFCATSQAV